MKFESKLIKATILKRYKRFLSDIELENGEIICAHVPNTGSMKTCWEENWSVYLSESNNPKRKLKYTLEMTDNGSSLISVNTGLTNKLAKEALENNVIQEFLGYENIKAEQKAYDSRFDFFLSGHADQPDAFIEVKNVTLLGENQTALFPDSVSTRGQKHLKDLIKAKKDGNRAAMLYVVNREDVSSFEPAKEIDPTYAQLVNEAKDNGVEILVYQCKLTPEEIVIHKKI